MNTIIEYREFCGRRVIWLSEGDNDPYPLWISPDKARLLDNLLKQRPDFLETFAEAYSCKTQPD